MYKSSILQKNREIISAILYPFMFVFSTGLFLHRTHYHIIPDFAEIKTYSKIYELFNLVISSLVSIIGIYITVSLVAYELFKQKSGVDFHRSFLMSKLHAYYISFSIATILFTFICSVTIPASNIDWNHVTVIYFIASLFCLNISLLFPVSFNLFSSLKPEKIANYELEKVNSNSIFLKTDNDIDKELEHLEEDSFLKIQNIAISLIASSDRVKVQLIIYKISLKLSNIIINESNSDRKNYIINRLISFYLRIIDFSLTQPNNSLIINCIWKSFELIYDNSIKENTTSTHFEKFREGFFEKFSNRLFDSNKEEEIYEGIETIRRIVIRQMKFNKFDDEKIYHLNGIRSTAGTIFNREYHARDYDHAYNSNWSEIVVGLMGCLTQFVRKAIKTNRPDILNKCFEEINIVTSTLNSIEIGIYSQSFLYIKSASIISDYTYSAFQKGVFTEGHDASNLLPVLFYDLVEEKHLAARTILQKYCYLLINLQKIGKIDRWFLGGLSISNLLTLQGDLGQIAEQCARVKEKDVLTENCLRDCIETFKILKANYESKLPENIGLYLIIKQRFIGILDCLSDDTINSNTFIEDLKYQISSFKNE